jgi:hypothetical protein
MEETNVSVRILSKKYLKEKVYVIPAMREGVANQWRRGAIIVTQALSPDP